MEIIGAWIIVCCVWYAQTQPEKKKPEVKKKSDYTIEIHRF